MFKNIKEERSAILTKILGKHTVCALYILTYRESYFYKCVMDSLGITDICILY